MIEVSRPLFLTLNVVHHRRRYIPREIDRSGSAILEIGTPIFLKLYKQLLYLEETADDEIADLEEFLVWMSPLPSIFHHFLFMFFVVCSNLHEKLSTIERVAWKSKGCKKKSKKELVQLSFPSRDEATFSRARSNNEGQLGERGLRKIALVHESSSSPSYKFSTPRTNLSFAQLMSLLMSLRGFAVEGVEYGFSSECRPTFARGRRKWAWLRE